MASLNRNEPHMNGRENITNPEIGKACLTFAKELANLPLKGSVEVYLRSEARDTAPLEVLIGIQMLGSSTSRYARRETIVCKPPR